MSVVTSFNTRVGAVVSAVGDYLASQVNNDSIVAGTRVSDALNTLAAAIASIPAAPVSSVFARVGAVVAAAGDYAASKITNDSSVVGAFVKDALNTLLANSGKDAWTWADAASRTAQSVTSAQIGARGFQSDIQLRYVLVSVSPTVWGRLEDPTMSWWHYIIASVSAGFSAVGCAWGQTTAGTLGNRVISGTGIAAAMPRTICQVAAATAGSVFYSRAGAVQQFVTTKGARVRGRIVLGTVSANMRWAVGTCTAFGAADLDPRTFTDSVLIGRNAETSVQIYHNDSSGTAAAIPLGASFPPVTTLVGYDFEFLFLVGGTTVAYQVINIDTGAVVSGTFNTDVPVSVATQLPCIYASNNVDAVQVQIDVGEFGYQVRNQP